MASVYNKHKNLNIRGKLITIDTPLVMGILNITPDSFFDGGKFYSPYDAVKRVEEMLEEGADIIDVGAWSSHPGAKHITPGEEQSRLFPVLDQIVSAFPGAVLSVDTYRAELARRAVEEYGVSMVNDISGGNLDPEMFKVIAETGVPYVLMHMKGVPETMQNDPFYENLMRELMVYFSEKVTKLRQLGVTDIIIDPGFGFGKTVEHNYEILERLDEFKVLEVPVLVGLSRKSMICKMLDIDKEDSLNATTAANMIALQNGADILRVHDVKEAKECIKVYCNTYM